MCWPDIPTAISDLYCRNWPKLYLNAHLPHTVDELHQPKLIPREAYPDVPLDEEASVGVPSSAWRILPQQAPSATATVAQKRALSIHSM
jgi:hypothetical protein